MSATKVLDQAGLTHLAEIFKKHTPAVIDVIAEERSTAGQISTPDGLIQNGTAADGYTVAYFPSMGKIAFMSGGRYYNSCTKRALYCKTDNTPFVGKFYAVATGGVYVGTATGLTKVAGTDVSTGGSSPTTEAEAMTNDEIDALFDF